MPATKAKPKSASKKKPQPPESVAVTTTPVPAEPALHPLSKFARAERRQVNRSQLNNATYNPRKITGKAKIGLRGSIEDHGILQDPVWNQRTGNIVGGHQRVEQLDTLQGNQEYSLFVYVIDVDEPTEIAINIALNNPNIQGEMDPLKILDLFQGQKFDLDLAGYTPLDIELMAFNAGFPTEMIDGMFSPQGKEQVEAATAAIDDVIEQSNALKKRKNEQRRSKQAQDEDEDADGAGDDADSESAGVRDQTQAGQATGPHDAEYFRAARNKQTESMIAQRESSYARIVVFGSDEQAAAFNEFCGLESDAGYIDGPMLAELLGCKLPPLRGKRKASAEEPVETADRGNV